MTHEIFPAAFLLAVALPAALLNADETVAVPVAPQSAASGTTDAERLEERLDQLAGRIPGLLAEHRVPGLSMAVVDGGELVWSRGFGVRQADRAAPVDPETVMEACSMSKPFFAYLFLQLVEQGKWELDRPLVDYLEKDYLDDDPRHREITASMVLTHTSGFPNWRKGGWRAGGPLMLEFDPGARFRYSGEGFLMLQRAIEKRLGADCDVLSRERLIGPLALSRTRFVWDERFRENFAEGHDADGTVKPDRRFYERANAAFTLYTTAEDYARFLIEVMQTDRSAAHSLSEGMRARMLTAHAHREDQNADWGLGWGLRETNGRRIVYHSGSNSSGFRCYSEFCPESQQGLVIMTNGVNGRPVCNALVEDWQAR